MISEVTLVAIGFCSFLLYKIFLLQKRNSALLSILLNKIEESECNLANQIEKMKEARYNVHAPLCAQIQDMSNRIAELTNLKVLVEKNLSKTQEATKESGRKIKSDEHRKKISEALKRSHAIKKGKELLEEQLAAVEKLSGF